MLISFFPNKEKTVTQLTAMSDYKVYDILLLYLVLSQIESRHKLARFLEGTVVTANIPEKNETYSISIRFLLAGIRTFVFTLVEILMSLTNI